MSVAPDLLKRIVEAALLAAAKPMTVAQLQALFDDEEKPGKAEIEAAVEDIQTELTERGFELVTVANGWRFQVCQDMAPWIGKLWEEKPQKYSRALLETLALVAYRQPITRGEIEEIRGVAVSTHIMKTLVERNWIKVVGHRDVPGRPSMYATTRDFLDYFNLKSLDQLPTLAEIRDLDTLNQELNLVLEAEPAADTQAAENSAADNQDQQTAMPDSEIPAIDDAEPAEPDTYSDIETDSHQDNNQERTV